MKKLISVLMAAMISLFSVVTCFAEETGLLRNPDLQIVPPRTRSVLSYDGVPMTITYKGKSYSCIVPEKVYSSQERIYEQFAYDHGYDDGWLSAVDYSKDKDYDYVVAISLDSNSQFIIFIYIIPKDGTGTLVKTSDRAYQLVGTCPTPATVRCSGRAPGKYEANDTTSSMFFVEQVLYTTMDSVKSNPLYQKDLISAKIPFLDFPDDVGSTGQGGNPDNDAVLDDLFHFKPAPTSGNPIDWIVWIFESIVEFFAGLFKGIQLIFSYIGNIGDFFVTAFAFIPAPIFILFILSVAVTVFLLIFRK